MKPAPRPASLGPYISRGRRPGKRKALVNELAGALLEGYVVHAQHHRPRHLSDATRTMALVGPNHADNLAILAEAQSLALLLLESALSE